ncbi:hypothetical protein V5O48_003117 [Marasmius crinis-equi]|uniref:MYND-type domain-containing protein n=1 Tax=Marasmius crinis-equi TaxID=585013 RepID=A0ABR3FTR7_9AGAR
MHSNPRYTTDILDNAHLLRATHRFKTSKCALQYLARLGSPPRPAAFNKSHPSAHVEEAVQVLATIVGIGKEISAPMSKILAGDIQEHWSHLAPWIKFFLEEVVVSRSIPSTIEEYSLFEHTIAYIPLLMSISPDSLAFFAFTYRASPALFPCFTQAWWRSVDERHPSARIWSHVVWYSLEAIARANDTPKLRPGGPYLPNHDLGVIYARHIDFISPHIRSMPISELGFAHNYMQCILRPCFPPGTVAPNLLRTVSPTMIPPLLNLLHGILFKRPFLRGKGPLDEKELCLTYGFIYLTIEHIFSLMIEATFILHVLETGVIKCIIEGLPLVAKHRTQEPQIFMKIVCSAYEILDRIARFLVYPAILHGYLKSVKNLSDSNAVDNELGMISKELGEAWLRLKHKAILLRTVRRDLKNKEPAQICGNSKCSLRPKNSDQVSTQDRQKVRYFRCSSCHQVMYCSSDCQRSDWRAVHKKACHDLTKDRKGTIRAQPLVLNIFSFCVAGYPESDQPYTSNYDRRFFLQWGMVFVEMHAREIRGIIKSYRSSLLTRTTTLSPDERLVAQGKNPLLLLDFDTPGFQPVDCVRVIDSRQFLTETRFAVAPGIREVKLQRWRGPKFDGNTLDVHALFPMATDMPPWPFNMNMLLPE